MPRRCRDSSPRNGDAAVVSAHFRRRVETGVFRSIDADFPLVTNLFGTAERARLAFGEHERLQAELRLARWLQESILPKEIPSVPGYELFAGNIPSRGVSGDYYQVAVRDEGTELVIGLADVCGKGMGASLIAATLEAVWSLILEEGCPTPCTRRWS